MPTNFNLNNSIFSVSDISDSIKKLVEQNFSSIKIKGEISKPSFPASGHIYFNLKDENSIEWLPDTNWASCNSLGTRSGFETFVSDFCT